MLKRAPVFEENKVSLKHICEYPLFSVYLRILKEKRNLTCYFDVFTKNNWFNCGRFGEICCLYLQAWNCFYFSCNFMKDLEEICFFTVGWHKLLCLWLTNQAVVKVALVAVMWAMWKVQTTGNNKKGKQMNAPTLVLITIRDVSGRSIVTYVKEKILRHATCNSVSRDFALISCLYTFQVEWGMTSKQRLMSRQKI